MTNLDYGKLELMVLSQTKASQILKTPVNTGKYEVIGEFVGGPFSPKLGAFDLSTISKWTRSFIVVEDFYLDHGNGS